MAERNETEVLLTDVRGSFLDIYRPGKDRKAKNGDLIAGKYGGSFLMEKGTPATLANLAKIKKAKEAALTAKYGDEKNWPKYKPEKLCVRDGDLEEYDGYEGCYYLASNRSLKDGPPQVIQNIKVKDPKSGQMVWAEVQEGKPRAPYSGCRVNALVRLWIQDDENGKRVNASLEVVQFRADGEAFSGNRPVNVNDAFGDELADDGESMGEESFQESARADEDGDSLI